MIDEVTMIGICESTETKNDVNTSEEIVSLPVKVCKPYIIKENDELTRMVVEYKITQDPDLFEKIYWSKSLKRLFWQVIKNYGVMNFPIIIQEDIAEDCQSVVLLRTIDKYDQNKGASFGTLFTWWCMSHVRNKRNQWLRREPLLNAYSLSGGVYNGDSKLKREEVITGNTSTFNENAKLRISRNIAEANFVDMPVFNKELVFTVK